MSDTITLPREVVKLALDALEWSWGGEPMGTKEREAITALRTHLAAPKQEPEPEFMKDLLTVTLRVVRGDRVFQIKRFLRLEHIEQLPFKAVGMEADKAWQELDAAMKEDKR